MELSYMDTYRARVLEKINNISHATLKFYIVIHVNLIRNKQDNYEILILLSK